MFAQLSHVNAGWVEVDGTISLIAGAEQASPQMALDANFTYYVFYVSHFVFYFITVKL